MNQSRRIIESLNEGTSTKIFFNPKAARMLAEVLATPVPPRFYHRVGMILSDDQIADTLGSWPVDEDTRPVVLMRLAEWLDEGPGPWREPWDKGAQAIIEDLASVALAVKKMMAKFQIVKKVDWNKLMADREENDPFKRALERVAKLVSKDFHINTKGAEKFINQMVDMRISVLKI